MDPRTDMMDSFMKPESARLPFEFLLNEHFKQKTNFRKFDFGIYFAHYLFGFISVIPETTLKQKYGVEKIFWKYAKSENEQQQLFKIIILTEKIVEKPNNRKIMEKTMRVKNFFLDPAAEDFGKLPRALTKEEYEYILDRLDEEDVVFDKDGFKRYAHKLTLDEYIVSEAVMFKNEPSTSNTNPLMRILVQKLKSTPLAVGKWTLPKELYVQYEYFEEMEMEIRLSYEYMKQDAMPMQESINAMSGKQSKVSSINWAQPEQPSTSVSSEDDTYRSAYTEALERFLDQSRQLLSESMGYSENYHPDAECGLRHGAMLATQSMHGLDPTVYHRQVMVDGQRLTNSFYMSIERLGLTLHERVLNDLPVTVSFTNAVEHTSRLSFLGTRKNTLSKVYSHISTYSNYGVSHVQLKSFVVKQPNVFKRLWELLNGKSVSGNEKATAPSVTLLIEQEFNNIKPLDVAYDVKDANFLSRYLLGLVTAEAHANRDYHVYASVYTKSKEIKSFILVEKSTQTVSAVININEKASSEHYLMPDDTEFRRIQPSTKKVFVITIDEQFEHDEREFIDLDTSADFVKRMVSTEISRIQDFTWQRELSLFKIQFNDAIENKFYKIGKFSQEKISSIFERILTQCKQFLKGPQNFKAYLAGLFHNVDKLEHGSSLTTFQSKRLFSIKYFGPIIDADEMVTINFASIHDDVDAREFIEHGTNVLKSDFSDNIGGRVVNVVYQNKEETGEIEVHVRDGDINFDLDKLYAIPLCGSHIRKKRAICQEHTPQKAIEENTGLSIRYRKYFAFADRTANRVMGALMFRNIVGDIINGDLRSLSVDGIFFAAGISAPKLASMAENMATKLTASGRVLPAAVFSKAAKFMRFGTPIFATADLIGNVVKLAQGDNRISVKAKIGGDSLIIAGSGLEAAEFAGIVEGSSTLGPVGILVGTAIVIGADIYEAVEQVQEIEKHIHLTGWEKFKEGMRAFWHAKPEAYIQDMVSEEIGNEKLIAELTGILRNQTSIKRYIVPSICIQKNSKTQPCRHVTINARQKYYVTKSRLEPSQLPSPDVSFFCHLTEDAIAVLAEPQIRSDYSKIESYFCKNAIGLENINNMASNVTVYRLEKSVSFINGSDDDHNIFYFKYGQKYLNGGGKEDTYVIMNDRVNGTLNGFGGTNTLDFSFVPSSRINSYVNITHGMYYFQSNATYFSQLKIQNIQRFLGRQNLPDIVKVSCQMEMINLKGGKSSESLDYIHVPLDENCMHKLQLEVPGWTYIKNDATLGNFTYFTENITGVINLELSGSVNVSHNYRFENVEAYEIEQLNVQMSNSSCKVELFYAGANVTLTIKDYPASLTIGFKNGAQLQYYMGHIVLMVRTKETISWIMETYSEFVETSGLSLIAYSTIQNQSLTINHGMISFDGQPQFPFRFIVTGTKRTSHIVCGYGENLIHVNFNKLSDMYINGSVHSYLPAINVYFASSKNDSIKTIIDLSRLAMEIKQLNYNFELIVEASCDFLMENINLNLYIYNQQMFSWLGDLVLHNVMKNKMYRNIQLLSYSERHFSALDIQNSSKYWKNLTGPGRLLDTQHIVFLKPENIFIDRDNIIMIASDQIEYHQKVIIKRSLLNYDLIALNNSLMITNLAYTLTGITTVNDANNLFTIIIENFNTNNKMGTLKLHFRNTAFTLNDLIKSKLLTYDAWLTKLSKMNDYLIGSKFSDLKFGGSNRNYTQTTLAYLPHKLVNASYFRYDVSPKTKNQNVTGFYLFDEDS